MQTNPSAIRVVCFGDSNTWGSSDTKHARLPANERWTGRLQELLGDGYEIIEEGCCGRTVELDDGADGRNGLTYLPPMIKSQVPIDVLVIMLGTNDLKAKFGRSAGEVADSLKRMLDVIPEKTTGEPGGVPAVIVISPIHAEVQERYGKDYPEASVRETRKLARAIEPAARAAGAAFLDASTAARPGADGLHFSPDSHQPFAEALAPIVRAAHSAKA